MDFKALLQTTEYDFIRNNERLGGRIMLLGQVQLIAVRGDITKEHGVQAIVNAANTSLLGGGGCGWSDP